MADYGRPDPTLSIVDVVDFAAKAIALIVGAGLVVGTAFNIFFFLATKPHWLFHLSVADNIAATFYAIPVTIIWTVLILGSVAIHVHYAKGKSAEALGERFSKFLITLSLIFLVTGGITFAVYGFTFRAFIFFGYVAIFVVVVFLGPAVTTILPESPVIRWGWVSLLTAAGLITGAALGVVDAIRKSRTAEVRIESSDVDGKRSILSGQLVRVLDGGVILQQPGAWVWIPRDQVRRMTEVERPK